MRKAGGSDSSKSCLLRNLVFEELLGEGETLVLRVGVKVGE